MNLVILPLQPRFPVTEFNIQIILLSSTQFSLLSLPCPRYSSRFLSFYSLTMTEIQYLSLSTLPFSNGLLTLGNFLIKLKSPLVFRFTTYTEHLLKHPLMFGRYPNITTLLSSHTLSRSMSYDLSELLHLARVLNT